MKTSKQELLDALESCLFDFFGEEPTRRKIHDAWVDILDAAKEDGEEIPKSYYHLSKLERERLYKIAEV